MRLVHARQMLAGCAVFTFLAGFLFPLLSRPAAPIRAEHEAALPAVGAAARPLSAYLDIFRQKNLFQGGQAVMRSADNFSPIPHRAAKPAAPQAPPKPKLAELAANYQVVGLLNGNAQAVISNKKTQETLYVSAGEHLADMTVTSVGASGVTLSYEGQTLDLPF